jgi:hypothetical protein
MATTTQGLQLAKLIAAGFSPEDAAKVVGVLCPSTDPIVDGVMKAAGLDHPTAKELVDVLNGLPDQSQIMLLAHAIQVVGDPEVATKAVDAFCGTTKPTTESYKPPARGMVKPTRQPAGGGAKKNPFGAIAPPESYAGATKDAKTAAFAEKQKAKAKAEKQKAKAKALAKAAAEAAAEAAKVNPLELKMDLNGAAAGIIKEFNNMSKNPSKDKVKIAVAFKFCKDLQAHIKHMIEELKNRGLTVWHHYNSKNGINWFILSNPADPRRREGTPSKIEQLVEAMLKLGIRCQIQFEMGEPFGPHMKHLRSFGHTSCHTETYEDEDGDEQEARVTSIQFPIHKRAALLKYLTEEVDCHIFPSVKVWEATF